jgi:hypothetical protein
VSNYEYYLLWLVAGLVIVAIMSAVVVRHLRLRVLRRVKSAELLDALARYAEWVAAQRAAVSEADAPEDTALGEVRALAQEWFPELSTETEKIFALHSQFIVLLSDQRLLRQRDPEAWLESDHDVQFMELWRSQLSAVQTAALKLEEVVGATDTDQESGRASPA